MTMTANGLAKLLEECGELVQEASKKLAYFRTDTHPDGKGSLAKRLQDESADVVAAISLVSELFGFDKDSFDSRVKRKLAVYREWHADQTNGHDSFHEIRELQVEVLPAPREIHKLTVEELFETATKTEHLRVILDAIDAWDRHEGNHGNVDQESWDKLTILVAKHKKRIEHRN